MMSGKSASAGGGGGEGKVVVVAAKASKEISKAALVWALTRVVQPGDTVKLLLVVPTRSSSKKMWDFSRLTGDCSSNGSWSSSPGTRFDQRDEISDMCSEMLLRLNNVYDPRKVNIRIKVVSGTPCGGVTAEVRNTQSNWVILDKHLKHEKKACMEELECNVVVMKKTRAKVLRLNLISSTQTEHDASLELPFDLGASSQDFESEHDHLKGPDVTPASSPDNEFSLTGTDIGRSSVSSSDLGASPFFISGSFGNRKKLPANTEEFHSLYNSDSDTESVIQAPSKLHYPPWVDNALYYSAEPERHLADGLRKPVDAALASIDKGLLESLSKLDFDTDIGPLKYGTDVNLRKSVREVISLSSSAPPGPPPLCSLCQHKTPAFGNPPKWFAYAELEMATNGFSEENFLAEGGFGSVHRGVLPDGQVVAVKQHKLASSQGDLEFCSEVEVLSCAQHRNVVTLIGFCVEDGRRLLVYEYICNGSLDQHLLGKTRETLKWSARQKIAVGAARGLRYLHEECRVGCIVHRDMRPNNILITHYFEPLVGDFGLARWQPDGDIGVETRIIGTFGYLAPEYAQSGQITEKADVYSFGVVLAELVTGRKAIDLNRPKGQHCLTEWARPLLENHAIHELIDPRLGDGYPEKEVHTMLQCASLCIRRDPELRPRISQVLRMLESYVVLDSAANDTWRSHGGTAAKDTSNSC